MALLSVEYQTCSIESFLMSCRVALPDNRTECEKHKYDESKIPQHCCCDENSPSSDLASRPTVFSVLKGSVVDINVDSDADFKSNMYSEILILNTCVQYLYTESAICLR